MKWQHFVEKLRTKLGFKGAGDDFEEVITWLKQQDLDSEAVEDEKTGTVYVLKDLFDARGGRRLNVSDAVEAADKDEDVKKRVADALRELGVGGTTTVEKQKFRHDVKVGKDRLTDDPMGGFKHAGQFFCDVIKAGQTKAAVGAEPTEELVQWRKATLSTYGNEAVGADGAFLVPPEISTTVLRKVTGEESLIARTRQFTTGGNMFSFPVDEDEPWDSTGIQAEWRGEAQTMTQRKPVLTQKTLRLKGLDCLCPITEELMEDAPGVGSYISELATDVIEFKVGEAFFRGIGSTQPLGFLNGGGLKTVTKEGSQGNGTVIAYNIIKMWSALYSRYREDAVWFINQTVEPELYQLSLLGRNQSGGYTSSFGRSLYIPPGGISEAPYGTLMGRPVIVTEHTEELGGVGDVVLASMSQYATLQKSSASGIRTAQSMHLWFDQAVMALRFTMRIDGTPISNATIQQRDDTTNTYGAFVVISARE